MNFYDRIKFALTNKIERKNDIISLIRSYSASTSAGLGNNYQSYAHEGYGGNPDVFACVREIATAVRGIPWVIKQTNRDGEVETIREHPMLTLLNKPNAYQSGSAFRNDLVSYHLIGGSAFCLRVGPNDLRKPPKSLFLVRPDSVGIVEGLTIDRPIDHYTLTSQQGTIDVPVQQMLQVSFFNPLNNSLGMSPMQPGATSIDIGNTGRNWNKNLIGNSCRPPGGFSTESELTDAQWDRLDQSLAETYAGAANAGRPLLMEHGLSWESYGLSPAEMDWMGSQKMSTVDVCKVFNVAPELIGDASNKTYSNYKEARIALYQETVLPLLDFLVDELNNWLTPLYGSDIALGYDIDAIEALQENRDAVYTRMGTAWWLTPNERRLECGMATLEDPLMDGIYVPTNVTPLNKAGTVNPAPTPPVPSP